MQSQTNFGIIYNTRYRIIEEEEFLAEKSEAPYAEICTDVQDEDFLECCALIRKRRTLPIIVFSAIGIAMVICAILGSGKWQNENKAYFIALCAALPLGIVAMLCLKSYFRSAGFYARLSKKVSGVWRRSYEIRLYSDCMTCYDSLNTWKYFQKGIEVIPYTAFVKILRTQDHLALADKDDRFICVLLKDMHSGTDDWIISKCSGAKLIEKN